MSELETLTGAALVEVTGGMPVRRALRVAAKVIGLGIPGVDLALGAWSGVDGVNAYRAARESGQSVGSSLWSGAQAFVVGRD